MKNLKKNNSMKVDTVGCSGFCDIDFQNERVVKRRRNVRHLNAPRRGRLLVLP